MASAPAMNLQAVLNRWTGLTIIAFIQKIGSRGSDPQLLGLTPFSLAPPPRRPEESPRIMKVEEKDGVMRITLDHPDPAIVLIEALGTVDPDFLDVVRIDLAGC
jgi:hypothetical protein